jgi:spermidine/putrescine transport system substrate-binding protein
MMPAPKNPIRILASAEAVPLIKREISRRNFLSLAAIAGSTALLAACSPSGNSSGSPSAAPGASGGDLESELSMYTWGDYDAPEVLSSFTDELGPAVLLSSFSSNEEMVAKLVAARGTSGYDVIVPTGAFIPQMVENGLLLPINKDLLPNLSNMDPQYLGREWDPQNEYSICKAWGTTGYVYDNTVITRELTTWDDFFDAAMNEASGKTSLLDDPAGVLGPFFWRDEIDWNTTDEAQLTACRDFLVNELASHISAFDSYPGSTAIPQGTQALMQVWNGDARLGIIEAPDPSRWTWVLPGPATELWMDNWAIADGAPHPEAAHAFINWSMTPESMLANLDYIGYHVGGKDLEQVAADAGLERVDMLFFSDEQLATMHEGELNDSQGRRVEIWNEMKAAAGA